MDPDTISIGIYDIECGGLRVKSYGVDGPDAFIRAVKELPSGSPIKLGVIFKSRQRLGRGRLGARPRFYPTVHYLELAGLMALPANQIATSLAHTDRA